MNQGEYKLFEGPVDFGQFFFAGKTNDGGDTLPPNCGHSHQKQFPRPIVKTQYCLSSATCSSVNEAAFTGETALHSQRSPGEGRGHVRSLSCSSGGSDGGGVQCVFCKRNGETREYYTTHTLKDWRGWIVCPVLRGYTCPNCGATGDHAHTQSHCPLSSRRPSLMASLRTRRSSCGTRVKYPSCKH